MLDEYNNVFDVPILYLCLFFISSFACLAHFNSIFVYVFGAIALMAGRVGNSLPFFFFLGY